MYYLVPYVNKAFTISSLSLLGGGGVTTNEVPRGFINNWNNLCKIDLVLYMDGLVQDCYISSALALEILQSCSKSAMEIHLVLSHQNAELSQNCHCWWLGESLPSVVLEPNEIPRVFIWTNQLMWNWCGIIYAELILLVLMARCFSAGLSAAPVLANIWYHLCLWDHIVI